jgi:sensor c-di-GMP phosphodiesterase-like protein
MKVLEGVMDKKSMKSAVAMPAALGVLMLASIWTAPVARAMTCLGLFLLVPIVIYALLKWFRITLRFDRPARNEAPFDVHQAVRAAMHDAGISLAYRPIQRMSDGGVFGLELVVCWRQLSGQTLHVLPSDFVALAEKNSICLPFDVWLWTTALTQASVWQHQHGPLVLAFDITADQFNDTSLAPNIRAACAQAQFPHQLLALKVQAMLVARQSPPSVQARVDALHAQGLSVAVDHLEYADRSVGLQRIGHFLDQAAYFHQPLSAADFELFLTSHT